MGKAFYTTEAPAAPEAVPAAPRLPDRYADESYKLFSKVQVSEPTLEESIRIRNKCVRWVLPFLCVGYHLMYVDKQTVSTTQLRC
jgi:hypothetical protein